MVSTQPVLSLKYFRLRKNNIPKGIKELFYLSWEDALWDILTHKKVKKGSLVFVPDFYCSDVEKNISKHGYRIIRYHINSNLEVDKKSFLNLIKKYKPAVVIVLHPVGIKSNLFDDINKLVKISGKAILIEDAVHRTLSTDDFTIIKTNHFVMDSLRKVVPLQGCRVFGKKEDLNFNVPPITQAFWYFLRVNANCFLMNICWTLGLFGRAEKLMLKGYDLIGDSQFPARGSMIAKFFGNRLDTNKIQSLKQKQVSFYERELKDLPVVKLKIKNEDKKHLRGYPVILAIKNADKILSLLRKNRLLVRFELNECRWSKKQKIIYLPMGIHVNLHRQKIIMLLVKQAFAGVWGL